MPKQLRRSFKRKSIKRFKKTQRKRRKTDKENAAIDFYVAKRKAEQEAEISSSEEETEQQPTAYQKLLSTLSRVQPAKAVEDDEDEEEEREAEETTELHSSDDEDLETKVAQLLNTPEGDALFKEGWEKIKQEQGIEDDSEDEEEEETPFPVEQVDDTTTTTIQAPTTEAVRKEDVGKLQYDRCWYEHYFPAVSEGEEHSADQYSADCTKQQLVRVPVVPPYLPGCAVVSTIPLPGKVDKAFQFLQNGPKKVYQQWATYKKDNSNHKEESQLQKALFSMLSRYVDVLYCGRTWQTEQEIMEVITLHMWKHITNAKYLNNFHDQKLKEWKTAKRKEREKAKKGKKHKEKHDDDNDDDDDGPEYRDKGFTPCRILLVLPMRNIALRYIQMLIDLHNPTKVKEHERFVEDFSLIEGERGEKEFSRMSEDYQKQFEGNTHDDFCFGVRLTDNGLQLFDHFFYCDIIVASPLGLAGEVLKKKNNHGDFLSSIELLIMDQACTIHMFNWNWVTEFLKRVNQPVQAVHSVTDYTRLYSWLQDKCGQFFRQTIIISSYLEADIIATFRKFTNKNGKLVITPDYKDKGSIAKIWLPNTRCLFQRIECETPQDVPQARYDYFVNVVMPSLQSEITSLHVKEYYLIFIPSYFDFAKLRVYFNEFDKFCFCEACEYTPEKERLNAVREFKRGDRNVMLYTERCYYHTRFQIRWAKRILFYQPPTNASFYSDMVNNINTKNNPHPIVTTLFTKFDRNPLCRILGSQATDEIISSDKDCHYFR